MEVLGFFFLDRVSGHEISVVSISGIPVSVCQGLHGDEGTSAAEVVFVLDGNAGPFGDTTHGGSTGFVAFAVPAARAWGEYEGGVHGEGIVGGKVFVGIEFGREGLEIRVQAFTSFLEFTHGESGGLEGMGEGTGLHGKMDRGVWGQRRVGGDLSFDGST